MQVRMTHYRTGIPFQFQPLKDRLILACSAVLTDATKDVALITATWRHKPRFVLRYPKYRMGKIQGSLSTGDSRWIWTSHGTKRHVIPPRKTAHPRAKRSLKFYPRYSAKTSPMTVGSRGSYRAGQPVFRKKVIHPGVQPRKFLEAVAYKRFPDFRRLIRIALNGPQGTPIAVRLD